MLEEQTDEDMQLPFDMEVGCEVNDECGVCYHISD